MEAERRRRAVLKKIISIENVGRFKNSAGPGNPQLARHTVIHGANGFGKTTLCAVLRSLKSGDPAHIAGRRTLGVAGQPSVKLLLPSGPVRFDGAAWSAPYPGLAIFDGVFVAENVHSGEVVEIGHRRNLYRVIIGEKGVRLAEEDTRLAAESREKTGQISAAEKPIQPYIPAGMNLAQFIALPADPEIDTRIAQQERAVEAVQQVQQIQTRPPLAEITVPTLPEGFAGLLGRTIDDIAQDAEARLAEHLAAHSMEATGGNWIAKGLEHTGGGTCPFCGQDIQGLPLIASYRAVFSDRYKSLRDEITAMRNAIGEQFGDGAIGRLTTRVEQNKGAVDYWSRYCTFDLAPLVFPDNVSDAIRGLGRGAVALLDRKHNAPLERVELDDTFLAVAAAYEAARTKAQEIAEATRTVNCLIAAKKAETGAADVRAAETELARRRAIKARHSPAVAGLCADHARLSGEKKAIEDRKNDIRAQLNEHTKNVVKPYERRINDYLEAFNAEFRITETKHGYPGGSAASSYQVVINKTAIDLGDGNTPTDQPSFKNTLSSGDRTTLALAFFLAHLDHDPALVDRIVVFDDPFNSQDAFRRRQTVHEIGKVAQRCAQVVVLSHDAAFLKQVWDKAPAAERVALSLVDHRSQGMKIMELALDRACEGRTATELDDLQSYLATGAGKPLDLIRKMRVVLETHCWTIYPASFRNGQHLLGEIVRKIREGGEQHPAWALYDELDQINDYSKAYHHGEDVKDATPDQIDLQELTGYVRRTLRIVNALQA